MTRKILLSLFLLATLSICNAQTMQYIWAKSGLNMRSAPEKSAGVVKKLPFGTRISIINDSGRQDSVKEAAGFYIRGTWKKVAAGSDTGYVFGGFLLPEQPVPFNYEKEWEKYSGGKFEKFLYTNFKPAQPRKVLEWYPKDYCKPGEGSDCAKKYRIDFQGIVLEEEHHMEAGGSTHILIPGRPLREVYLWAMYFLMEDPELEIEYINGAVNIGPKEGAGCWVTISEKNGAVKWEQYCGC